MQYVQKLPYMLGIIAAVIVGSISMKLNLGTNRIFTRMLAGMVIFMLLGMYARSILQKVIEETDAKKLEEAALEEENKKGEAKSQNSEVHKDEYVPVINYGVDDKMSSKFDEFEPLKVSEVISSELKK